VRHGKRARRFRGGALAITLASGASLAVAASGAQAVSGPTAQTTSQAAPTAIIASTSNSGQGATAPNPVLNARLLLRPQGLSNLLRSGIAVRVISNEPANGIASVSISRNAAKRAHINTGRGPSVVIARGTVSQIKNGTVNLHLKLAKAAVAKLETLQYLALTVRLSLVASGGGHSVIVVTGRY
jgi:hypothetical protein